MRRIIQGLPDLIDTVGDLEELLGQTPETRSGASSTVTNEQALADLDLNLTTPERARLFVQRYSDDDKTGNPGLYNWVAIFQETATGSAPVTAVLGRVRAESPSVANFSGRGFGNAPQAHALETIIGLFASVATVQANGTDTLQVTGIARDDLGSRFIVGMNADVVGTGISVPGGTTILEVTGRPGNPSSVRLSNPVSGPSGTAILTATPTGAFDKIANLATGNGLDVGGIGYQVQSQGAGAFDTGYGIGASGLRSVGKGFKVALANAARAVSVESSALAEGLVFATTSFSNAGIYFAPSVTGQYGIRFSSDGVYSIGAIYLPGQNIVTDTTTGMILWTSAAQRGGFFGRMPQPRPTLGVPVATDLATVIALANATRAALIQTGNGLGLVAA